MFETLRYILRELRPFKSMLLWLSALSFIVAGANLLGPLLMAKGIDAASMHKGFWPVVLFVAAWFVNRTMAEWLNAYVGKRGDNIAHAASIRHVQHLYERLISLPMSFHYGAEGRRMQTQVGDIRWRMSNLIITLCFGVMPSLLTLAALVAYIAWVDPLISVVLAVALVVFGVYTVLTGKRTHGVYEEWNKAWNKVMQSAGDALGNILVVKSTQAEGLIARRVTERREAFEATDRRTGTIDSRIAQVQSTITGVALALVMAIAALRLQDGSVSVGGMTAILAYAFNAFGQLRQIQHGYRNLIAVHAARQVIEKDLLSVVPEDPDAGTPLSDIRGEVAFDHVAFRYREDRPILSDVSFTVKAGERIAIVGESGEGKSTIVDLIGRYYDRTAGVIRIDGTDVRESTLRSLRGAMAYVPQDLSLLHETIEENVRFGKPDATEDEVREAMRQAQLEGFVASLPDGIKTVVGERGLKLSGGERQRVALARAFLRKPAILILDEPTSNLDSKTEMAVQQSLRELMRGRTTFVIAHRLKTVQEMDRILVLKDGVIAEQGTHKELLQRRGAYYELLAAQHLFITPDEQHLGEDAEAAE